MNKKSIVLMIPQLRHGGAERVVSRLSFLLRDYFDISVVVFDKENITYDLGCDIISLDITPLSNFNIIKAVKNLVQRVYLYKKIKKSKKIDITYSFGDSANLVNVLSGNIDRKVVSIRGYKRVRDEKGAINKLVLRPISRFIYNESDSIITVSEVISHKISNIYGIDRNKIITLYNGYDLSNIRMLCKEKVCTKDHRLFSNSNVFITAGTFRSEKGYWHLLKSFSLVRKKDDRVKLYILGEDYREYKSKVINLIKLLGIEQDVILGGYQHNPYKFFAKSMCYVLSSTSEGFPNALVEAMSCGLPVISSDCKSGPREIISPSSSIESICNGVELCEFGILVKPMNPIEIWNPDLIEDCDEELARAMILIKDNSILRSKYSSQSLLRSEQFNYDVWLEKHLQVLR
ncbi:MAG: glycosyltransferase [Erysipelotrichaceae bacterium]|nr:glycosyltransferase [Erysipelotrichaceae bacterium]